MTISAMIVDDEPLARARLRAMVGELDWIEVIGEATDGAEAASLIDSLVPDLVFLDIHMPELDGLQVLGTIRHDPAVIFTTAFDRYAVSAFELEAVDYLLKPFGRERLHAALDRARRSIESGAGESAGSRVRDRVANAVSQEGPVTRLLIRDRGRLTPIAVDAIERVEAADDYVTVVANGRGHLVYMTLSDFERRLDAERFVRIHRSHIVNLEFVREIVPYDGSRMHVAMRDGTKILASRSRSKVLRRRAI